MIKEGAGGEHALQSDRDLEFGLTSERASGLFAEKDGQIWLMHSGHVHRGRPKLSARPTTAVRLSSGKDRSYHSVAKLCSSTFVSDIAEFGDLTKRSGQLKIAKVSQAKHHLAFDPGAQVAFSREGHSVDPQPAQISYAFADKLQNKGW